MKTIIEYNERSKYYSLVPMDLLPYDQQEDKLAEIIDFLGNLYEFRPRNHIINTIVKTKKGIELEILIAQWDGLVIDCKDKATLEEIQPEIEKLLDK